MGSLPASRREALLDELCVRYGYCHEVDLAVFEDARSAEDVVRAVLVAEGLAPLSCDRKTRAELTAVVNAWLLDPHGRGARSGLPL